MTHKHWLSSLMRTCHPCSQISDSIILRSSLQISCELTPIHLLAIRIESTALFRGRSLDDMIAALRTGCGCAPRMLIAAGVTSDLAARFSLCLVGPEGYQEIPLVGFYPCLYSTWKAREVLLPLSKITSRQHTLCDESHTDKEKRAWE